MTETNESGAMQLTSKVSLPDAQTLKNQKNLERVRRYREKRSAEEKARDNKKSNEAKAIREGKMSNEEKADMKEKNKLAVRRFRAKQTNEEIAETQRKDRERKQNDEVRRSNRIRMQNAREDMSTDQKAVELEQNRMRMETHRCNTKSQITLKDGLRSKEILLGTFPVQKLEDSADAIGNMDVLCPECGAFKFRREPPGFCCSSGKVKTVPFPKPPGLLSELWMSNDTPGKLLKKYSREINNAVALSSITVTEKKFGGFTPSVIFQGQVKHRAGALLPANGEVPRYAQLYCLDARLEKTQRFENMYIPPSTSKTDKDGLKKLLPEITNLLHAHNPFVKDFKMILEIPEEELGHGKIVISAKERPRGEHARRYNAPANFEEVSILTNEEPHDLVLQLRGGGLRSIHDLNPKGMPLHFTLLFPLGT